MAINPESTHSSYKEINLSKHFRVEYGSIHKYNPLSVVLLYKGWSTIRLDARDENYDKAANKLNKNIRKVVYNVVDDSIFDKNRTIVLFEFPTKVMQPYKHTYVTIEISLYQRGLLQLDDKDLKRNIIDITQSLETLYQNDDIYKFKKNK